MPRGLKVLLVCGDGELALQFAEALRGFGCAIEGARDCDEAMARLRSADPPRVAICADAPASRDPSESARRLRAGFPDRELMVLIAIRETPKFRASQIT